MYNKSSIFSYKDKLILLSFNDKFGRHIESVGKIIAATKNLIIFEIEDNSKPIELPIYYKDIKDISWPKKVDLDKLVKKYNK